MSDRIANYEAKLERPQVGLLNFLWDELKPFPGRDLATIRMAIVCTAIVLLSNTFRLPLQDVLPFLALFTAKEAKITTTITAILALVAMTVAVGAAILVFKCTGNRPEFRIPGMAVEIFVGMYLFRVLSIKPVGFILAFIVSVAQSVVDLFPTPEQAVHEFLWLWVAVALAAGCGWLGTLLLFPVSANRVLQREFIAGWQTISMAAKQLRNGSLATAQKLLLPVTKLGPTLLLKLMKFSLLETHGLRPKQKELIRLSLALDKVAKLLFSYSSRLRAVGTSSRWSYKPDEPELIPTEEGASAISSSERVVLGTLAKKADYLEQEFSDGFVPSPQDLPDSEERAEESLSTMLIEAERTLDDLAVPVEERQDAKPPESAKKSLFVTDAFTNPRHLQFALKVTLAGIIGYIFYTASDYFGIHTVYYTPLIIALGSTGATMHKGVLRIVGCVIGGALGLICTIWLIPRFDTLGMYLLTVFCVHGLAAWVAFGSERISYMGLQIALAFDLGVLTDYGPSTGIDPIRDRFIGIILGIVIISTIFSLFWPEDARSVAREKLAACVRAIARLLNIRVGRDSDPQRERLELEIASHLAEANDAQDQAAFEALIRGGTSTADLHLEIMAAAVEETYVTCLPWIRERAASLSDADQETALDAPDMVKPVVNAVEATAATIENPSDPSIAQSGLTVDDSRWESSLAVDAGRSFECFEQLVDAVKELQIVVSTPFRGRS